MKSALKWLDNHQAHLLRQLERLVAIPTISFGNHHQAEIQQGAEAVAELMRWAGLQNVEILTVGSSNPYVYGEWLGAPGKPTVFLYIHLDVQPVNFPEQWRSDPWQLTERDGRLYGRGTADDKGAIVAQLGAIAALLQTRGTLPVNIKMVVESEEEIGSPNLQPFFQEHAQRIQSDLIVVCDTDNLHTGLPGITNSLRGLVALKVTVETAQKPVHSGMGGGAAPDAALALNVLLSRLYRENGPLPIPHFYDKVRPLSRTEREALRRLPGDEAGWREKLGLLPEAHLALETNLDPHEQTWRRPAVSIIAQEAGKIASPSNQVLHWAEAIVSCRIVPDQEPEEVSEQLAAFLTASPPWGAKVSVTPHGEPVGWWWTDPQGPAFDAARRALHRGYGTEAVIIGCGGSIGFVEPLSQLLGGAPALLLGMADHRADAHAPNESLDREDLQKLTRSLAYLFEELGR